MRKPQTAKYANIESLRAYDAKDFPFVDVRCPELEASDGEDSSDEKVAEECWFRLRSMTLGDRERIEQDLIVMGAYGHSRIRQFFVGSHTRNMVSHSKVPLLLLR